VVVDWRVVEVTSSGTVGIGMTSSVVVERSGGALAAEAIGLDTSCGATQTAPPATEAVATRLRNTRRPVGGIAVTC
jgi:hypothetical protein